MIPNNLYFAWQFQAAEFGIKARTTCEGVVSGDETTMKRVVEFLAAVERIA